MKTTFIALFALLSLNAFSQAVTPAFEREIACANAMSKHFDGLGPSDSYSFEGQIVDGLGVTPGRFEFNSESAEFNYSADNMNIVMHDLTDDETRNSIHQYLYERYVNYSALLSQSVHMIGRRRLPTVASGMSFVMRQCEGLRSDIDIFLTADKELLERVQARISLASNNNNQRRAQVQRDLADRERHEREFGSSHQ